MRVSVLRGKVLARRIWSIGAALAVAAPALALPMAGPRVIRIEGKLLQRPVVLSNWRENEELVLAMTDVATVLPNRFTGQACVTFTLYWETKWNEYVNAGKPLAELTPDQGDQHGCFYPAVGNEVAIFLYADDDKGSYGNSARIRGLARRVGQPALDVLAKHGIPLRIDRR